MPDEVTYQEKVVFKAKSVFNSLEATVNVILGASFQGISIVPYKHKDKLVSYEGPR